jgi:hypothetical protein
VVGGVLDPFREDFGSYFGYELWEYLQNLGELEDFSIFVDYGVFILWTLILWNI